MSGDLMADFEELVRKPIRSVILTFEDGSTMDVTDAYLSIPSPNGHSPIEHRRELARERQRRLRAKRALSV